MPNADIPLSERGETQAQALAARLDFISAQVTISAFLRTRQTAAPWLEKLGIRAATDAGINEFNTLSWERIRHSDHADILAQSKQYWQTADPHARMGQDAETFAEFCARVDTFTATLATRRDGSVLFTHGMFLSLLMWRLPGYPAASGADMRAFRAFHGSVPIPNTAVFALTWGDKGTSPALTLQPQWMDSTAYTA